MNLKIKTLFSNSVNSLQDYISFTRYIYSGEYVNPKIYLDTNTMLYLNKIRSYEIDYFKTFNKNGAAFFIIEKFLQRPCKMWNLLGKEMAAHLKYWLDAVIDKLLQTNVFWWKFAKPILRFIQELRLKDSTLPKILFKSVAEHLLELSVIDELNVTQRYEVVYCLSTISAQSECSTEFAWKEQYNNYFRKLSTIMAICGHFPLQYVIMQTIMQWQRQDRASTTPATYFPLHLFMDSVIKMLKDDLQDTRAFLNAHNKTKKLVVSMLCKTINMGQRTVLSVQDKNECWLDINTSNKSVSLMLEPNLLKSIGLKTQEAYETLFIKEENTRKVRFSFSDMRVIKLSINMMEGPLLYPSNRNVPECVCDVTTLCPTQYYKTKTSTALKQVFGDKCEVEESLRYPQVQHRRPPDQIGFSVRNPATVDSVSTSSTTTLAQLHDKLTASAVSFSKDLGYERAEPKTDDSINVTLKYDVKSCKRRNELPPEDTGDESNISLIEVAMGESADEFVENTPQNIQHRVRKINETSSESSKNSQFDLDQLEPSTKRSNVDLNIDLEVKKCLDFVVNEVCINVEKSTKNLIKHIDNNDDNPTVELKRQTNLKDNNRESLCRENPSNNTENTFEISRKSLNKNTKNCNRTRNLKLKYRASKKKTRRNTKQYINEISDKLEKTMPLTRKRKSNVIHSIDTSNNNQSEINVKSVKRRRKLYSPKNDDLGMTTISDLNQELEEKLEAELCPNSKSSAIYYKELDQEHRRLRKPVRKSNCNELSPRTQKLNTIFDQLRENVESNEKIMFVNKKSNSKNTNFSVYNLSSDSDFEMVDNKNIAVRKQISSSIVASYKSSKINKRNRVVKNLPKRTDSTMDETGKKGPHKENAIKLQIYKRKINNNDLIDEKVRQSSKDNLHNSSIVDDSSKVSKNVEPTIVVPQMELLYTVEKKAINSLVLKDQDTKGQSKKSKNVAKKKISLAKEQTVVLKQRVEKNIHEDKTVSPLPSLIIEPEPTRRGDNSLSTNMIQSKQMYQNLNVDIDDIDTTHNLLSDVSQLNWSCHSDAEIRRVENYDYKTGECKMKIDSCNKKSVENDIYQNAVLEAKTYQERNVSRSLSNVGVNCEKSISTVSNSPITSSYKSLTHRIPPRNLEIENMDISRREYINEFMKEMTEILDKNYCNELNQRKETPLTDQSILTVKPQYMNLNSSISKTPNELLSPNTIKSKTEDIVKISNKMLSPQFTEASSSNISQEKSSIKSKSNQSYKINASLSPRILVSKLSAEVIERYTKKPNRFKKSTEEQKRVLRYKMIGKTNQQLKKYSAAKSPTNKFDDKKVSRKSLISPIQIFDDFSTEKLNNSETDKRKVQNNSPQNTEIHNKTKSLELSNPNSPISTSTKIELNTIQKRKIYVKQTTFENKKINDDSDDQETQRESIAETCASRTNEWLNKHMPTSHKNEHTLLNNDCVAVLMEKLHIFQHEISESMEKRYLKMSMEIQKRFNKLQEEKNKMYKNTVKELAKTIDNLINAKFETLKKRVEEMHQEQLNMLKNKIN